MKPTDRFTFEDIAKTADHQNTKLIEVQGESLFQTIYFDASNQPIAKKIHDLNSPYQTPLFFIQET